MVHNVSVDFLRLANLFSSGAEYDDKCFLCHFLLVNIHIFIFSAYLLLFFFIYLRGIYIFIYFCVCVFKHLLKNDSFCNIRCR